MSEAIAFFQCGASNGSIRSSSSTWRLVFLISWPSVCRLIRRNRSVAPSASTCSVGVISPRRQRPRTRALCRDPSRVVGRPRRPRQTFGTHHRSWASAHLTQLARKWKGRNRRLEEPSIRRMSIPTFPAAWAQCAYERVSAAWSAACQRCLSQQSERLRNAGRCAQPIHQACSRRDQAALSENGNPKDGRVGHSHASACPTTPSVPSRRAAARRS